MTSLSQKFSQLQTGFVYHYAFIILVALAALSPFFLPAVGAPNPFFDDLCHGLFLGDLSLSLGILSWIFLFTFFFLSAR